MRSETEENILEYLKPQGVTHVNRFTIRKNHEIVNTNTLLLTFNSVVTPKTLKIFYQLIQVEMYVPNPLRCFNCQKFGHHENNCPADLGSVCEKCGTGNHDHLASQCRKPAKCVNCGENHMSRSSDCDVWKKEKEVMKIKVTQRLTYPEARKIYDQQKPEFTFSKVVSSMPKKPETKTPKDTGKSKAASHQHLNSNFNGGAETNATTEKDIADTLGDAFSKNSSNANYPKEFQNYQKHQEKIKLNFKSSNNEEYNNPFNLDELKDAINKSHDTATGPDEIHYQMLKHLPPKSLKTLLDIFNDIWETGKFPESWELATIIPIPKPGKDHAEPTNYRPIALTSCICKTLERMINTRLVWYLEFNNLISPVQSGFRSERSTNDNLVRLETFIRDAFVKKEHVVAVFFDLEKAYDTTWKYGILRDLQEFGVKGRLASFVESFLANRSIQVRVEST